MSKIDYSKIAKKVVDSISPVGKEIKEYKTFYREYLTNLKSRETILFNLNSLCNQFKSVPPRMAVAIGSEYVRLELDAENFLKANFPIEVFKLYDKEVPRPEKKSKVSPDDPTWIMLLSAVADSFEIVNEKYEKEWKYKGDFLHFLHNCISNYGLHPEILNRDPLIYKRYNILVEHDFKSRNKLIADKKIIFSFDFLKNEYLFAYENQRPLKINGKLIPFKNINRVKITSTLLLDDELELFAEKSGYYWNHLHKDEISFIDNCSDETDELLMNPHLHDVTKPVFKNHNIYFIEPSRIEELRAIKSKKFDLIKLILLCDELNHASINQKYITIPLLIRTIIDHVPPVFSCANFSEVANNYSNGTRSFKKSMQNLQNSLRNIADSVIHSQIKKKDVKINRTQVDFSPDLDVLLSEIIVLLSKK